MTLSHPHKARNLLQKSAKKRLKRAILRTPALWITATALALTLGGCSTPPSKPTASNTQNPAANQPFSRSNRNPMADLFDSDDDNAQTSGNLVEAESAWQNLREGMRLDRHQSSPQIEKELAWYRAHPAYLYKVTEKSSRYLHYVVSTVQQRNMPTELALLPFIESAFDPFALSRSGASGLWQFIPGTGRKFGLQQSDWFDGRRDVVASTNAALNYLQALHDQFNGDWLLAVAAYNFGEGNIQRAIDANKRLGKPTDFWSLSIREETRTYVPRLLALARIVEDPRRYGITLYHVPDRAYFASVDTYGPLDLTRAADLADISVDEMRKLNPGLRRMATDPKGPHKLLVPAEMADRFTQQLAQIPPGQRLSGQKYQDYRVINGDTLLSISRKFAVDPATIRTANRLKNNEVGEGQLLLIPGGQTPAVASPRFEPTNNSSTANNAVAAKNSEHHTVAAGENLWQIARRYNVKPTDIQHWNNLGANSALRPGQQLIIGTNATKYVATVDKRSEQGADTASKTAAENAAGNAQKVGYTVRNGDSLFGIAKQFNVQVEDIVRWNQVNPRSLRPGQKLTLYVD